MNRLTINDASRVVSLLDEALQKLALLGFVPDAETGADAVLAELDTDAVRVMRSHWETERELTELLRATDAAPHARPDPDDALGPPVRAKLKTSTRVVCRLLTHSARSFSALQRCRPADTHHYDDFVKGFSQLRENVQRRLATSVNEDHEVESAILHLDARVDNLEKTAMQLRAGLATHRAMSEEEARDNEEQLEWLRASYLDQEQHGTAAMARLQKRLGDEQAQSAHDAADHFNEQMTQLNKLHGSNTSNRERNFETERVARLKYGRARGVDDEAVKRLEGDMDELRGRLAALKQLHTDERAQVAVLEKHFDLIDLDLANEMAEMQGINRHKAAQQALVETGIEALNKLRANWRGRKDRERVAQIKKAKRKKKGKKGKKKKK